MRSKYIVIVSVVILMFMTASLVQATWNTTTVVKPDFLYSWKAHRSVAWDPINSEFVAAFGGDQLYVARGNEDQWDIEVVDETRSAGASTSVVVTDNGTVHISYYISETGDLWYAKNDGAGWILEEVQALDNSGLYNSLAVGSDGTAYIAYSIENSDLATRYLHYIDNSDGVWDDYLVVDPQDGCGNYNSIALNAAENPAIAYYCSSSKGDSELKYSSLSVDHFVPEQITTTAGIGASMLFDDNDYPQIAYRGGTDLFIASDEGSGWFSTAVDATSTNVGSRNQIFQVDGALKVLTYDNGVRNLLLYSFNGSTWDSEIIRSLTSGSSWEISGDFDDSGNLTMFYLETNLYTGSLHTCSETGAKDWPDYELVSFEAAGKSVRLALDEDLWPHMAYIGNMNTFYTGWNEKSWEATPMDDDMLYLYNLGIALLNDGRPTIIYKDWSNNLVRSWRTGSVWDTETITGPNPMEYSAVIRVDGDGNLHLAYIDSNHDLIYAHYEDGTGWTFEPINTGSTWMEFDMEVGTDDTVHVCFMDSSTHQFSHAFRAAPGTWYTASFSSSGTIGNTSALVLNDQNLPYILYSDSAVPNSLHLKYHDGSKGWQDLTLATNASQSTNIGLDMDDAGNIHFSYMNTDDYALTYGYLPAGDTMAQFVDIDVVHKNFMVDSDLALDDQGRPVIAYNIPAYGRLMLAVDLPTPTLDSIDPVQGNQNETVTAADIQGEDLFAVQSAALEYESVQVICENMENPNRETLTCDFDLTGAPAGAYDLVVTTVNGEATLEDAFVVLQSGDDDDDDSTDDDDDDDDTVDDDDDDSSSGAGGGNNDDDGCCGC